MSNWTGGVGFTGAFFTARNLEWEPAALPQAKVELARAERIPTPISSRYIPRGEPWLDQLGASLVRFA
jgi:hypothetical protein